MKKQLTHISVLQTAKVAAAMYFTISALMIVVVMLPIMMIKGQMQMSMFFLLLMPLVYLLLGFVFTVVLAWVYNMIASVLGGIEYTTTEVNKN